MIYDYHPEALQEYAEATQYYLNISSSLSADFVSNIENGINQILLHPEAWHPVEEDIRRYLVQRFPYGIYYTIESDDYVMIQAVMHLNREPDYWKSRLKDR